MSLLSTVLVWEYKVWFPPCYLVFFFFFSSLFVWVCIYLWIFYGLCPGRNGVKKLLNIYKNWCDFLWVLLHKILLGLCLSVITGIKLPFNVCFACWHFKLFYISLEKKLTEEKPPSNLLQFLGDSTKMLWAVSSYVHLPGLGFAFLHDWL